MKAIAATHISDIDANRAGPNLMDVAPRRKFHRLDVAGLLDLLTFDIHCLGQLACLRNKVRKLECSVLTFARRALQTYREHVL